MNLRQDLIDWVLERLRDIRVTNGYNTDVGLHVHEWRSAPFSTDDLPALNVRDIYDEVSYGEQSARHSLHKLFVSIQYLDYGDDLPRRARAALADIEKALSAWRSQKRIIKIEPITCGRFVLDQGGYSISGVLYELFLIYQSKMMEAY